MLFKNRTPFRASADKRCRGSATAFGRSLAPPYRGNEALLEVVLDDLMVAIGDTIATDTTLCDAGDDTRTGAPDTQNLLVNLPLAARA